MNVHVFDLKDPFVTAAWEAWEKDKENRPHPCNAIPFIYGFVMAAKIYAPLIVPEELTKENNFTDGL